MRQKAVIIDLDGTLFAYQRFQLPGDGSEVKNWNDLNHIYKVAPMNEWCAEIVRGVHSRGTHIIFLTARTGSSETKLITENSLREHLPEINDFTLLMRSETDLRPDFMVKQEIYMLKVAPYYEVLFAIDDKHQVVNTWRSLGLTALHCDDY